MTGKLTEADARLLALRIAAARPGREAATSVIKDEVARMWHLTPEDLQPSQTRDGEQMWQQVVGNVVSHMPRPSSIFTQGWAERTEDGIRVTDAGSAYLKSQGF